MLNSYLIKLKKKKSIKSFSIKTFFLKILQYLRENICIKFLRTAVYSSFWTDFMKWLFGTLFLKKQRYQSLLNQNFKQKFGSYVIYIFNPYTFLWT